MARAKKPQALPGHSAGKLPGRSKVEEGVKEGRDDNQKMENELMNAIIAGEPRETDTAEGGVTRKAASVDQSTKAREVLYSKSELGVVWKDWLEGNASGFKQKWNCSQAEDDIEEQMDWLENGEMMKQWEDVGKEEEKITVRKMEGRSSQVDGVQKAPQLLVSQVFNKGKGSRDGGERKQAGVKRNGRNGAMEEHRSINNVWKKCVRNRGLSAGKVQGACQQERNIRGKR